MIQRNPWKHSSGSKGGNSKEDSDRVDSQKLDELAELLRELDRRRGLSAPQLLGLLFFAAVLVFLIAPFADLVLGSVVGPVATSVFIAMLVMFLYEDFRSSNITKRTGFEKEAEGIESEEQESLDEFDEPEIDEPTE